MEPFPRARARSTSFSLASGDSPAWTRSMAIARATFSALCALSPVSIRTSMASL